MTLQHVNIGRVLFSEDAEYVAMVYPSETKSAANLGKLDCCRTANSTHSVRVASAFVYI